MQYKLKLKALTRLAHTEGEKVMPALNKEAANIEALLIEENNYYRIEESIELLNCFAFRMHDRAIDIVLQLLNRLNDEKYEVELGEDGQSLIKYYNKYSLIEKALEVLQRIRYFDVENILDIFLRYSVNDIEKVRKKAEEGLKSLSDYNLDIVYGGENNPAYGLFAQQKIVEYLRALSVQDKNRYFMPIMSICRSLLSPTVTGTSSTYKEFTWKTAAVPADNSASGIRSAALDLLQEQYEFANTIDQKLNIVNTMYSVVHGPHIGKYSDELKNIINENVVQVLTFYKKLVETDALQVIQKIEHNSYWIFYHRGNDAIKKLALEIRDTINKNEEYQIYKVLVGFEGVFGDWDKENEEFRGKYEKEKEYRETKLVELASSINSDNYSQWEQRILTYADTQSDDLATFPYFAKFLEHFSKTSPELAMKIVRSHCTGLERFLTPLLIGIWVGNKGEAIKLLTEWINGGLFLFSCARLFEFTEELDEELLRKILEQATKSDDVFALIQIISSVFAKYTKENNQIIESLFLPTVLELTRLNNSNWINVIWFRKDRNEILLNLDDTQSDILLTNLLADPHIDYHAEEVLTPIAKNYPESVIKFFGERLIIEEKNEFNSYDAIPFSFHELKKPLSNIPDRAVDIVRQWYDGDYGMFSFRGANLLKIIFPDFPKEFENKLIELVKSGDKNNIDVVLATLRNYQGEIFLHNICKELIKVLPDDETNISEIEVILMATGVVSGEYGLAEAYKRKKDEVNSWLKDEDSKVRNFAVKYQEYLEKSIEHEIKRADESIALRKYEYGE